MKAILQILIVVFCIPLASKAQSVDTLFMRDGEAKLGKVLAINPNDIKFSYTGESLEYNIDKTDVNKIVFSSGRTEVITAISKPVANQIPAADHHGKIAVLPFDFSSNDPGLSGENMGRLIQQNCASVLAQEAPTLQVQDFMQTNALLAQQNLDVANISLHSPTELAQLLGVEYVLFGGANIANKGSSTYGSTVATFEDKKDKKDQNKGTAYASNNATTVVNYETTIDIRIYDDQGTNRYNNTRTAFGSEMDSYKDTVKYIIKRTPFGSKYKR